MAEVREQGDGVEPPEGEEREVSEILGDRALTESQPVKRQLRSRLIATAGFILPTLVIALWYFGRVAQPPGQTHPFPAAKSIAILPFKPLVAEGRDSSFELGMADALITKLGGVRKVIVRPMSAVRQYTAPDQDAVAAGRELIVDTVLDGSVQWLGERVRVRARLIDVRDGAVLWSYQCDEHCVDIFTAQDAISERVAGALVEKLTSEERQLLSKRYTSNTAAYLAYVRGRYFWSKLSSDGLQQASKYFNQAITIDPGYALAYSGLADTYNLFGSYDLLPPNEASPKAYEFAKKAIELDEGLAEAHTSLAALLMDYYWNWPEAEKRFKHAIALNPNYATAHEWYSTYLLYVGRKDESISEAELAQTLDPLSLGAIGSVGIKYFYADQYDRSLEQYRRMLEIDPNSALAHTGLCNIYIKQKKFEEALAEIRKARDLGMQRASALIGYIYALSGKRRHAQQVIAGLIDLSRKQYVPAMDIALIYIGLGDKDRAFEWMEKAYSDRDWAMCCIKVESIFDPIRSDPRFQNIMKRVGLQN